MFLAVQHTAEETSTLASMERKCSTLQRNHDFVPVPIVRLVYCAFELHFAHKDILEGDGAAVWREGFATFVFAGLNGSKSSAKVGRVEKLLVGWGRFGRGVGRGRVVVDTVH